MRRRWFVVAAALVCVSISVAVLVLVHLAGEDRTTSNGRCLTGLIRSGGHGCWMRGDVDGDGHEDAIAIVHRRLATGKRRNFLVAKTRNETLRIWIGDQADYQADYPNLAALARIDTIAGAEMIVADWESASDVGYSLYTVREQRLVRIRYRGARYPEWLSLLRTGGSAGLGENHVACPYGPSRGVLITGGSTMYATKGRVDVWRELWRIEGARLVLVRSISRTYSKYDLVPERVAGFPVLGWWEFAGCGVYPGDKSL